MKVYLDDVTAQSLIDEARELGLSNSTLIADIIASHLGKPTTIQGVLPLTNAS